MTIIRPIDAECGDMNELMDGYGSKTQCAATHCLVIRY